MAKKKWNMTCPKCGKTVQYWPNCSESTCPDYHNSVPAQEEDDVISRMGNQGDLRMIKGRSNIAIEDMSLDEKANHILEVLGFVERYADDDMVRAALIDAGYVIEQLQLALQRRIKMIGECYGNQNQD